MKEKLKHRIILHRKYWKKFGKRKVRRKLNNLNKDFFKDFYIKVIFYDYLD